MPFCALGLFSSLCTAFHALFGILSRGSKTVEKCKFLQDSKFQLLVTVIHTFKMFVTFTYLFLFCRRCRSEIRVWGLLPGIGSHCTVRNFRECFGKSLYGHNLLLTIQNLFFLLARDIRFSTNEGVYPLWGTANKEKILKVHVC